MIYTGIIMIRKPFCIWRICSLLAALFFIVPVSLHAQKRDFTTWASTGFKYKVNPAFTLSGKLEWRTKDDLDKTDRWGLEAGGAYSVLPFLENKLRAMKCIIAIAGKPVGSFVTAIILTERYPHVCTG
mgnify:CR=1 FL=1